MLTLQEFKDMKCLIFSDAEHNLLSLHEMLKGTVREFAGSSVCLCLCLHSLADAFVQKNIHYILTNDQTKHTREVTHPYLQYTFREIPRRVLFLFGSRLPPLCFQFSEPGLPTATGFLCSIITEWAASGYEEMIAECGKKCYGLKIV
ncbi:hypothetical protein AALO_G00300000 [Alosa alosa]|uniref:Uncharacterized protein n=1 Tax=Alosa alosa TaxID=278164 RepID=A0AAV6FIG9_9TELE|nr:hypothetical protein AALO_G00300000 [Alosa alosa]